MTDMFGNYKSQETRVLQSINSSKYPDTNIDLERNLQRLNSFVDYISQYLQVMQKGVDQANQDIFQRTRDVLQNFGVLLAGGAIFDNDFGDLQYFLPAIGALLGFDKDTPFPINLFHAAENLLLGYVVPLDAFGMAIMDQINNWADQLNINQEFMSELNEWVAAVGGLGATFGELVQNLFGMFDIFGVNENGLGFLGDIWHGISQLFGGFNLEVIGDLTDPILAALAPWLGRITDAVGWISSILKSWSNGLESLDGIINFSGLFSGINWAAPDFDIGDAVQEWMNNVLVPTNIFAHRVEFGTLSDLASQLDEAVNNLLAWFADILDRFGLDVVSQWIDDLLVTRGATNTALTNASTAQAKADLAEALANVGILRAKFGSNLLYSPNFENTTIQYWPYVSLEVSAYSYATEYRHSGNRSLRVLYDNAAVAAGEQGLQLRVEPSQPYMPAQPQSWYWVEGWFYVYSTHSNSGRLKVFADAKDSTGVNAAQKVYVYDQPFSGITKGVWTKFSGHIQLPAGLDQFTLVVSRSGCALNDAIYFDDMVMREVTEAKLANALATAAQALANTAQSLAQQALANFTAMLDRFGFTQIADWIEDLFGVKTTANTATANAATAIANAATADAKAVTAQTSNQTTVDNLYDAFNGTTGTTGQTTANMRNRGAAVRNSAITGETNSATALTNAATADAKAITAQAAASTADGKAVAADGKAVAAQTTANTANTAATAAQTSSNTAIAMANSAIVKGQNFVTNPGFENSGFYLSVGSYSTEQKRSGRQSLKLTGINQWTMLQSGISAVLRQPVSPGDVFYYEGWVYGHASNTNAQGTITVQFNTFTASGATASPSYIASSTVMTNGMNGMWTKFTGTLTIGAGTNIEMVDLYLGSAIGGSTVTNSYYFDDIVMYRITESYVADTKAVAAQGTANTAVTNAATADAKAVTADGKAVTADGKAVVAQSFATSAIQSGSNLVSDPLCLNNNMFESSMYSSDVSYGGTKSIKTTGTQSKRLIVDNVGIVDIPCVPGDVFYIEMYFYGKTTNTQSAGLIYLSTPFKNADKSVVGYGNTPYMNANTTRNGVWTKASAYVTAPAGAAYVTMSAVADSVAAGEVYYFSDCKMYRVTEASVAQSTVDAVATSGNMVVSPNFEDNTIARPKYLASSNYEYVTDAPFQGSKCLKITVTSPGWNGINLSPTPTLKRYNVKEGDTYRALVRVKLGASMLTRAGGYVRLFMRFHNTGAGGGYTDATTGVYQVNYNTAGADTWLQLDNTGTCPANRDQLEVMVICNVNMLAGDFFYLDAASVENVTWANAAQAQANTATTNAATADAKAVTADAKAVTADGKAVVAKSLAQTALQSGSNLATNPGFENTNLYTRRQASADFSTEQKRSGTYSYKTVGDTWVPQFGNEAAWAPLPCTPGDVYAVEIWMYGHASNPTKSSGYVTSHFQCYDTAGTLLNTTYIAAADHTVINAAKGVWTKISRTITIPANAATFQVTMMITSQAADCTFYWDDFAVYRITEANVADGKAVTATANAATADANAATADAKAVTADGKAVTAQNAAATADDKAVAADTKAVNAQAIADASIASGNNMLPNGDFENTSFWQNGLAYTTDQKYNGTRSVTFTSNGTWASGYPATTTSNTRINFPCQGGDIFWFDGWIMGKSTNTVSSSVYGTSIAYDKDGNDLGSYTAWTVDSLAVKDVWTKVGGFITMPANATSFTPYFSCNMTSGEVFYIDNLRLYRATEAYNADAKAVTADGKAVTADGKAVTADGKAVTAQTAAANAATAATTADDKAVTAQGAANDATNIGVNNSVDILELKTAQQGGAVSGYSATDTFNYTGTTLDSTNWNIQVTGTNGRLGANGVDAYWINGATTAGTTTEFDYWKTATNSDYQIVSVVVGNPFYGNSTAGYGPVARCDSTRSNYVWVQIQTTTLKLYKVVAGVQTQIGSTYTIPGGQQSKSGDVIQLEAGSSANVRQFKVRRNGNIVIDATDSAATLSVVGSNNRFPGLRYYVYANNTYVYTEGNVAAWSVTDNAPPDYVGSGFRAVKSSGSQSCSNNYNLLPNSFFTQEYKTADYTYAAATANKLTVSVSGWYHVELSLGLTINTMITDMAVCIYKNGVVNKKAGSVWGVSNVVNRGPAGVAGSFIVYLSAGDYIQPGYWQTTTYGGSGTIVGDSNSTYFDVALINKSML